MNKASKFGGVKGHKSRVQLFFLSREPGFSGSWEDLKSIVFYELRFFICHFLPQISFTDQVF